MRAERLRKKLFRFREGHGFIRAVKEGRKLILPLAPEVSLLFLISELLKPCHPEGLLLAAGSPAMQPT